MKILGLDICRSSVVVCLLEQLPEDPRSFFRSYPFESLPANAEGISRLLQLLPDMAVMEPTGVNYARLWGTYLARAGVEVRLVGHEQLHSYRKHLGLPLKNDSADALALACYGYEYRDDPRRWVQQRFGPIVELRMLSLRLCHLARVQSPIINRLRQDLAWQFPEVATIKSLRTDSGEAPLLWAWMAGERTAARYERMYSETVGLGLRDGARYHARRLCDLQREEAEIEHQMHELLSDPCFADYRAVFREFGFGMRVEALVLSQCYPIDNFLGPDGRPVKEVGISRDGKRTTRRRSLARFRRALGVAAIDNSSGERERGVVGGSDLCRKHLWLWCFTRIEPERARVRTLTGRKLAEKFDALRAGEGNHKQIRGRFLGWAAGQLFAALVERCAATDF